MSACYELFKGNDQQYYFRLKAGNGEPILSSEGYKSKQSAQNGINSVRENSPYDRLYERKTSNNHQYYFVLKASNGEVIGVSETYVSPQGREKGIESVKENGPRAPVKDLT